jgi:hypothetical protein
MLLERAVKKVNTLPDNEQDAIAVLILDEIEDDARWEKSFAYSQDVSAMLAEEAMAKFYAEKTEALNPCTL